MITSLLCLLALGALLVAAYPGWSFYRGEPTRDEARQLADWSDLLMEDSWRK